MKFPVTWDLIGWRLPALILMIAALSLAAGLVLGSIFFEWVS